MGKYLGIAVLLVGCSGGGSGGSIPIDNLGNELGQMACSKIFECCTTAEVMQQFMNITYNGQPITTEAQCEGFDEGLLNGLLVPEYKDAIAAGRIKYDGDAARACIDAAANLSCSAYGQLTGHEAVACSTPFIIPEVADGGACAQSYECTSNNCDGASNSMANGTCKPMPTEGQDCTQICAQGLYCAYDSTAMKETCQPVLPNGTTCAGNEECASKYCNSSMCADRPATCDGQ
jgi:hypothetical protein